MSDEVGAGGSPAWLLGAAALFLLLLAALVATSLWRREPPAFPITHRTPQEAGDSLGRGLVTLDARDRRAWVRFDFSRSAVVESGEPAGWDVAARRHRLIVNGGQGFAGHGGVIEVTGTPYEAVGEAPDEGYTGSRVTAGGDSVNSVFDGWYRYGFFSHLLEPKPATYIVRTADGRYAKLRILSYYCPGAEPGCLTFEYSYQGAGGTRLAP
ncbi:MAG: HmuY family protein [Gemmatimonadota bacterium]